MKKILSIVCAMLMLLGIVSAQEQINLVDDSNLDNVSTGILPDNKILWWFEIKMEKLTEVFSKKSKEKHAIERLAEAKKMMNNGKSMEAGLAIGEARKSGLLSKKYTDNFDFTQANLDSYLKTLGDKVTSSDVQKFSPQVLGSNVLVTLQLMDGSFLYTQMVVLSTGVLDPVKVVTAEFPCKSTPGLLESNSCDFVVALNFGKFYALGQGSENGKNNKAKTVLLKAEPILASQTCLADVSTPNGIRCGTAPTTPLCAGVGDSNSQVGTPPPCVPGQVCEAPKNCQCANGDAPTQTQCVGDPDGALTCYYIAC
jgi:hypothetical protein